MKSLKMSVAGVALLCFTQTVLAGEIDILVQKLVDKGVLTAGEAQQIVTETKEEVKKEIAQTKSKTLPLWLQTTKMKGDFRLRYQYNHPKTANDLSNERQRGRFRFRWGMESKINEKVKVGAGLATGLGTAANSGALNKDYARSTNQSFSDAFSKKPITLDYAFAEYTPFSCISFTGGKFKNPLWDPAGDFVWDGDINPEGGFLAFSKSWTPNLDTFLTGGVFVLDENSGDHDSPIIAAIQPGIRYGLTDTISLKSSFSFYDWSNVKGRYLEGGSFDTTSTGNTYGNTRNTPISTASTLANGYNTLNPALELSIKEPFKALNLSSINLGFLDIPYIALYGEYLENSKIETGKNASGQIMGIKLGAEKISNWGDWQLRYNYRRIERDAIPDILPDSDFYEGTTGISGHRGTLEYGLGKNTWLAINFFRTQKISNPKNPESVLMADWNLKF